MPEYDDLAEHGNDEPGPTNGLLATTSNLCNSERCSNLYFSSAAGLKELIDKHSELQTIQAIDGRYFDVCVVVYIPQGDGTYRQMTQVEVEGLLNGLCEWDGVNSERYEVNHLGEIRPYCHVVQDSENPENMSCNNYGCNEKFTAIFCKDMICPNMARPDENSMEMPPGTRPCETRGVFKVNDRCYFCDGCWYAWLVDDNSKK